jgi:hypothetical protein
MSFYALERGGKGIDADWASTPRFILHGLRLK